MLRHLLLASILLIGCVTPERIDLDPKWRPLQYVEEDSSMKDDWASANSYRVITRNPFKLMYLTEPVTRDALLSHEQVHAVEQVQMGESLWQRRYLSSGPFRTDAEKRGYDAQIKYIIKHGATFDVNDMANSITTGYNPRLWIDKPGAISWINSRIDHWKKN